MRIKPEDDGVSHINMYSRGMTEAGRALSHFSNYPVEHPEFGTFATLEGAWMWLSFGKRYDQFKEYDGLKAKMMSITLRKVGRKRVYSETFVEDIEQLSRLRVEQNPGLKELLLQEPHLPFEHYYCHNGVISDPPMGDFDMVKFYTELRKEYLTEEM